MQHFTQIKFLTGEIEESGIYLRERERAMGLFITLVPKVSTNVFLLVGLTTLELLPNFDWLLT